MATPVTNLTDTPHVVGGPSGQRVVEHRPLNLRQRVVFAIPALVVLILALYFCQGMRATDDLTYARLAEFWIHSGQAVASFGGHHAARVGMTGPLALILIFFGANNWSLALLPIICTMLTGSLVAMIAYRLFGLRAAIFSGCLYAFFPLNIDLATFYVPEPIATFEMTLASMLFLLAIPKEDAKANYLCFVTGLLVGIAYLTTEVGSVMIVVFGIYAGVRRPARSRYLWVLVGFSVVVGLELAYYDFTLGNPIYRFTLGANYTNDPMVRAANADLAYRLLKSYPRMFVYPNSAFGAFGPLLVAAGVYGLLQVRSCFFLLIWSAVIFAFYNFMSASLSHYVALPVAARLLAPGCVPLLILAGKGLAGGWQWTSRSVQPVFRILARASLIMGLGTIGLVSLVCMYLDSSSSLTAAIARNAETVARFLHKIPSVVLIADQRSAQAIQFYRQFNQRDHFYNFGAAPRALRAYVSSPDKLVFVVLNGPIIHEREITGSTYGGSLSLNSRPLLSEFLPLSPVPVFSAHVERPLLLDRLLTYRWVRGLMGGDYNIAKRVFTGEPLLGLVQVFLYHAAGARSGGSP